MIRRTGRILRTARRSCSLEWFTTAPPPAHNFDVLPDVRSDQPLLDIRDAIAHRDRSAAAPAAESQPVA